MADFQDEVSASLNQLNPVQGDNTELDDPHLGSEELSFTKPSDPNMDPLNPFSTQHTPLASMDNNQSDHGEETLTQYQSETHGVVYFHDDPGDFSNEEIRSQIFLDSDQSGDVPFSSASLTGRGDEVDETVQENIDSNPFSMEAGNQIASVSSGHNVDISKPGVGYNPFLNDEEEVEMDEEDGHSDDSQDQSDGFPDPSLNGPLGSVGGGDERGVNHTYNLLEEDEEEEVDIQMEPVENIQYLRNDEEEHRAPLSDEPQILNYDGLIGHAEDVSQCSSSGHVEDVSDSYAEQHTVGISDLTVAGQPEIVPGSSYPKERAEDEQQLASVFHSDDRPQKTLLGHCDQNSQDDVDENAEVFSMTTSAGHTEDSSVFISAEHTDDTSMITSGGHTEDISMITSGGHTEDISMITSAGHTEDISMITSAGHTEDISGITPTDHTRDISKIASIEPVKELSGMPSTALTEDISKMTSTGQEDEDTLQTSLKEYLDDASHLASSQVEEDPSKFPGYAEVVPSFTEEPEQFSQMPSRAHIEETPEFFHEEHDDDTSEILSSGVAEDTASYLLRDHDDLFMVSSLELAEHKSECPSTERPQDNSIYSSTRHVEVMTQMSSGFITLTSECPQTEEHEDIYQSSVGKHAEDMSQISSEGLIEDIPEFSSVENAEDVIHVSVARDDEDTFHISSSQLKEDAIYISSLDHTEEVSEIPSLGHVEDISEIISGGHKEDMSATLTGGHREDVSEISEGYIEVVSEILSGGHRVNESEIPSGGHREEIFEIPSEEHAEDMPLVSMTRDLTEITPTPTALVEDISHVSGPKDTENATQSSSSGYPEDFSQLSSAEVSSHFPPSFADESIYSKDTVTASQQHDPISDTGDITDHHIVTEESTQDKFTMRDSESYECLTMHTDNIDTTQEKSYEESQVDDKNGCASMEDEMRHVGQGYLNDMIIGEKEEEEDEAEHVLSKEDVQADMEGQIMDVLDSELVVSESSCGYNTKYDHEERDETAEQLVQTDNLTTFEGTKGVESDSDDMFMGNSYEVSQEKQTGDHKEHHDPEELKYEENEDVGIRDEKGFSSRIDSDIISSEFEDRSYVDNLSELASPDVIPQPLPSPPEPKDMSAFDPLAPCDTPSPCHEHNGEVGQQGALFEHAAVVIPDENRAADFLASVEVEGETKFGVDGTAITSTGDNNAFLHSDEDDEDDEISQNLDQGGFTTTTTTETETSIEDRSGDFSGRGFEQTENNDTALMSMSMEGSFYDDGGELMGGDDRRNQQQGHLYEDGYITEESSQHDSYEPKQEHFVVNPDEFGQKVLSVLVQENHETPQQGDQEIRGKDEDFDPLRSSAAPSGTSVGNGVCDGNHMGDIDSLLDVSATTQDLQQSSSEQARKIVSSVEDNVQQDFTAHKSESVVESQSGEEHKVTEDSISQGGHISDVTSEKTEKLSAEAIVTDAKKQTTTIPDAAAATTTSVAASGAAGGEAVTKTTTAVKKPSTKPAGKTTAVTTTTTTATTTKVAKETKATNGKAATATTVSKSSPKKHADSRPTSVATAERKPSSKAAGSPTKPATPPATKAPAPLPSYAQPIAHRKPREAKVLSPEEKKKKITTATNVTRASSAAPHPRPQSVSSSTATSSARTASRSASTVATSASRTAQLARPKSSPTKMTNGIASPSADGVKSPTTKHETDSKKEEHRPRSGRKEHKVTAKTDSGTKSATTPTTSVAKSPTKQASPLTLVSPKTGDIRSKIGSLENTTHTPGGGHVKIISKKPNYTNVSSKIGSKDNMDYKPGGGHVKIENRKIKVEAKSKIGSLENATHKPGGGDKKIEVQKTEWKAQSKIGSLDNAKHKPEEEKQTNGSDVEEKSLKNGLAENTGPAGISEHGAAELVNGSASAI